jgi:hypothetical protein
MTLWSAGIAITNRIKIDYNANRMLQTAWV